MHEERFEDDSILVHEVTEEVILANIIIMPFLYSL